MKRCSISLLMGLLILSLAACSTAGTPVSTTSVTTSIPPTEMAAPTATNIPPSATPTEVIPTASPTPLPENVIKHFPTGQELTITDIHMIDATTGWAIGSLGIIVGNHVLYTTDGGSTWKDVTPPETEAEGDAKAAAAFFQDAKTAWVTYGINGGTPVPTQPVVWHTSDGGATWQASQPLDVTGLAEIYVPSNLQLVDGKDGWLLVHVGVGMMHDYVAIYRTNDSGTTWTRIIDSDNDGGIQSCTKNFMLFTDANHGWLTGDCGGVKAGVLLFNTTDAGSSWQAITLPAPASIPGLYEVESSVACGSYDPFFFSNDLGHLGVRCIDYTVTPNTYSYFIYTTQDGGSTWSSNTYPGVTLYFFSADTGWALAMKIEQTVDGGITWKPISDVTWTAQMDFISEQIGWAVARSGSAMALVKTDNGGARWTEIIPVVGP